MQKRIDNKEVAFLKNLIKSRRGIAIELAIGVMMLMTAFSIILLTTGTMQAQQRKDDYNDLVQKIEINEIGEYVCENIETLKSATSLKVDKTVALEGEYQGRDLSNYNVTIDDNYCIIFTDDSVIVRTIMVEKIDGKYTIISWN